MKKCFDLIAARERELAQIAGVDTQERPYFTDEGRNISLVSLATLQGKQ